MRSDQAICLSDPAPTVPVREGEKGEVAADYLKQRVKPEARDVPVFNWWGLQRRGDPCASLLARSLADKPGILVRRSSGLANPMPRNALQRGRVKQTPTFNLLHRLREHANEVLRCVITPPARIPAWINDLQGVMPGEWRKQALSGHAPPENPDWRGFQLGEGAPFPGFFVGFPVPDVVNPLEGRDNFSSCVTTIIAVLV